MKKKMKTKKALLKRIKVTKNGKIKKLQGSRSHLRRNKSKRQRNLLTIDSGDRKLAKLI